MGWREKLPYRVRKALWKLEGKKTEDAGMPKTKTSDDSGQGKKAQDVSMKKFLAATVILVIEVIVFLSVISILFSEYYDFISPIIEPIFNFIKLLGPLGAYGIGVLIPLFIVGALLISLPLAIMRGLNLKSLVWYWMWTMSVLDVIVVLIYLALTWLPPDAIFQIKCWITNLSNPSQASQCQTTQQQTPTVQKLGIYDVVEFKIGNRFRDYEIPPIYSGEVHTITANVVNKNPDRPLKDVYFSGYIDNGSCSPTGDKNRCVGYVPTECEMEETCEVAEQKSVSLDSDSPVNYRTTFAEPIVRLHYSYFNNGEGKFQIFRNDEEAAKFEEQKPTSSDGPIDAVVYFAPEIQVLHPKSDKVRVLVSVVNKGKGVALLDSIKVTRSGEEALDFEECKTSWGATFSENEEFSLENRLLQKEFLFTCNYRLSQDYDFQSDFRTFIFSADVNYVYRVSESKPTSIITLPQ